MQSDEDVRGFDVTVNDPFLMGVLNGLANLDKQFQAFAGIQVILVAILRYFDSPDQFHHKKWPPRFSGAGVQHARNVWMIHHGQRLLLGFKPGNHIFRVHAQLDDFERNPAANRLFLLRHINHPAAAFPDFLQ